MEVKLEISASLEIKNAGEHVWIAKSDPSELKQIGRPAHQAGKRSVIGLLDFTVDRERSLLNFRFKDAIILNLGRSSECIIISLGREQEKNPIDPKKTDGYPTGRGDQEFYDACRREGLPNSIITLVMEFLDGIRHFSDDTLREGMHRKWVTYPNNFLAITIQNRKQQFCMHVRKTELLERLKGRLDVRDDRPGYARFWLSSPDELDAALDAARASYRKS